MTLILQSATAIAAPIFPSLDEIDPSLLISFKASDLTDFAEGALVPSFVAKGQASERIRTFEDATSGWNKPVFTTSAGRAALLFNGAAQIMNYTGSSSSAEGVPPPQTMLIALRNDATQGVSSRIFSVGSATSTIISVKPNAAPAFGITTQSTTVAVDGALAANTWGVIGIVFNGANSLFIGATGLVSPIALTPTPMNGIRWGGNTQALSGTPGFMGQIGRFAIHNRAMSDADLKAAWQAMAA